MSSRYQSIVVILGLWLLIAVPSLSAQPLSGRQAFAQYGHELWQTEQGLPQNTVSALWQTRDGYLWIGTLNARDWSITGRGKIYDFPLTKKGKPKYCTLEGLSWLSDRSFVTVSDLSKRHYHGRCRERDQSLHIFRLPGR